LPSFWFIDWILRKLRTREQPSRRKLFELQICFSGCDASFWQKPEDIGMPLFKYFGAVGSALLAVMFISDAYFGDDEGDSRFNGSLYESALYAPRLEDVVAAREIHFTRDVNPAARVKEIFAQFVPNEGRRVRK
jgi:hypothetical protein